MASNGGFSLVGSGKRDRKSSFEHYYRESYSLVYNYVLRRTSNREAAEDVVSEAFLRAARFYERFDPARAKFSTWVISIARNCISDYFDREVATAPIDEVPEGVFAQEDTQADRFDDINMLQKLLATLDDEEKELIYLKYYEGKRNVEIAEALGMNASTISTKLARAIAKMREAS
ncbi:MAG: sigma-70 family RNA polymerase sigma factor [Atopobiaceae bacterium]|nr:sigma-70 family RNA polymerase sigma factor [Atopobiaceae bacterium]